MDLTNSASVWDNYSVDNLVKEFDGISYEEEWRPMPNGYESYYEISSFGRVKSLRNGKTRIIHSFKTQKGYIRVGLYKCGSEKKYFVHCLVAKSFVPNPSNLDTVNHGNFIKDCNFYKNLEWMNGMDNAKDAWVKGKVPYQVGFDASNVSFTKDEVMDIYFSELSIKELCLKYNRPYMTIYSIKSGGIFKEITGGVSRVASKRSRIGKELIHACLNDMPVSELSKQIGLSKRKIHNIRYRYNGYDKQ